MPPRIRRSPADLAAEDQALEALDADVDAVLDFARRTMAAAEGLGCGRAAAVRSLADVLCDSWGIDTYGPGRAAVGLLATLVTRPADADQPPPSPDTT